MPLRAGDDGPAESDQLYGLYLVFPPWSAFWSPLDAPKRIFMNIPATTSFSPGTVARI
jgi:hypothetical protein